jgi:hypothetical protein
MELPICFHQTSFRCVFFLDKNLCSHDAIEIKITTTKQNKQLRESIQQQQRMAEKTTKISFTAASHSTQQKTTRNFYFAPHQRHGCEGIKCMME